jgi:hypothetical protein
VTGFLHELTKGVPKGSGLIPAQMEISTMCKAISAEQDSTGEASREIFLGCDVKMNIGQAILLNVIEIDCEPRSMNLSHTLPPGENVMTT